MPHAAAHVQPVQGTTSGCSTGRPCPRRWSAHIQIDREFGRTRFPPRRTPPPRRMYSESAHSARSARRACDRSPSSARLRPDTRAAGAGNSTFPRPRARSSPKCARASHSQSSRRRAGAPRPHRQSHPKSDTGCSRSFPCSRVPRSDRRPRSHVPGSKAAPASSPACALYPERYPARA